MLELDWLALGVAVKYQLPLDNSPQSTLMWKRHQAFSTHRRTLMSERLIKTPIRYYFDNIIERVKKKNMSIQICREVYQELIDGDLQWLLKQPESLERDHIEAVLRKSVELLYGKEE